jgi:hypothetical protein
MFKEVWVSLDCIMRFLSSFALLLTATALSGCAGNALEAYSQPCTVNTASFTCTPPAVAPTTGTTGTTTTTTTTTGPTTSPTGTPVVPNTGNTSALATGDTTIILEKSVLQVDPASGRYLKPGVSKLVEIQGTSAALESTPIPPITTLGRW